MNYNNYNTHSGLDDDDDGKVDTYPSYHKSVISQRIPFLSSLFIVIQSFFVCPRMIIWQEQDEMKDKKFLKKLIFAAISSDQILLSHKYNLLWSLFVESSTTETNFFYLYNIVSPPSSSFIHAVVPLCFFWVPQKL